MQTFFNSIAFTAAGVLVTTAMTLLYVQRSLQPDAGTHQYVITGIWALMALGWTAALIIRLRRAGDGESGS